MPKHVLPYAGKQYRSPKADQFATQLALDLRRLTGVASAYHLAKYHTIDDLKTALYAARRGATIELESGYTPTQRSY